VGPVGILGSHPDLSCELRAARGRGERTRFERLTALTPLKTEVLLGGCYTVPDEGYAKPEATNMTTPDAGPHAADAVIIAQTGAAGEVQTRLRTGCDDAFRVDAGVAWCVRSRCIVYAGSAAPRVIRT
jgi:hypothetical protein